MKVHRIAVVPGDGIGPEVIAREIKFSRRRRGRTVRTRFATVWSASQMLESFGRGAAAKRLLDIVENLLVERTCLTPDLGGTATTARVGDRLAKEVLS